MSPLERNYRTVLGLAYPSEYLDAREEEMIDTLLATADTRQRRPRARDVADLLWSGLAVRARMYGAEDRRRALTLSGLIAHGAVAFITALVVVTHLGPGIWTNRLPASFFAAWGAVALVPLASIAARRRPRRLGALVGAGVCIALVLGPDTMMVPRSSIVGLGWFALLATLAPSPRRRRALVLPVFAGAAFGVVAGVHTVSILSAPPYMPRPHDMFATLAGLQIPTEMALLGLAVLLLITVAALAAPRLGLVAAPLLPPITLSVLALSSTNYWYQSSDQYTLAASLTAASLGVVALSTLRTLRRRPQPITNAGV